jgi:hypothetical protein
MYYLFGAFLVLCLLVWIFQMLAEIPAFVWVIIFIATALISVLYLYFKQKQETKEYNEKLRLYAENKSKLISLYGKNITERIFNHKVWIGQTKNMLLESLGFPEEILNKVFKTKTKNTYKYDRIGPKKFATSIQLENDIVVGWSGLEDDGFVFDEDDLENEIQNNQIDEIEEDFSLEDGLDKFEKELAFEDAQDKKQSIKTEEQFSEMTEG